MVVVVVVRVQILIRPHIANAPVVITVDGRIRAVLVGFRTYQRVAGINSRAANQQSLRQGETAVVA
jgi:hypothetical protein